VERVKSENFHFRFNPLPFPGQPRSCCPKYGTTSRANE
jgi:hypothetical protein